MKHIRRTFVGLVAGLGLSVAAADDVMTLDELLAGFGWDLETAEIRTEKVADGLYVLFGIGGNIGEHVAKGESRLVVIQGKDFHVTDGQPCLWHFCPPAIVSIQQWPAPGSTRGQGQ